MKIRFCAALLVAVMAIPFFAGCAAAEQKLDTMEDVVENRLDAAEDAVESRIEAIITDASVPMSAATAAPTAAPTTAPTAAPAVPAVTLTKEEATAIALKDAGVTESQVTRLRTELDYDRGRAEYEVDFHVDQWEYDYEIDAETGKILSSDKDWDD